VEAREFILILLGALIALAVGTSYVPDGLYVKAEVMKRGAAVCSQIGKDVAHVTVSGRVVCEGGWKR
jgi:hypothetical protein